MKPFLLYLLQFPYELLWRFTHVMPRQYSLGPLTRVFVCRFRLWRRIKIKGNVTPTWPYLTNDRHKSLFRREEKASSDGTDCDQKLHVPTTETVTSIWRVSSPLPSHSRKLEGILTHSSKNRDIYTPEEIQRLILNPSRVDPSLEAESVSKSRILTSDTSLE